MSLFDKSGCELIYLASSFALALSKGLECDDINVLSAFLNAVADNLAIIAAQCPSTENSDNCNTDN